MKFNQQTAIEVISILLKWLIENDAINDFIRNSKLEIQQELPDIEISKNMVSFIFLIYIIKQFYY